MCRAFLGVMSTNKDPKTPAAQTPEHATDAHRHALHEAGGAAGGAIAGAAIGAVVGPVGVAAGVVIGGVVGAFCAKVADEEADRVSAHDHDLDAVIGVSGGSLGAPNLKHPPATRGTYSAASSGGASGGGSSADGPMPKPEE
jgi:hypothetical protein